MALLQYTGAAPFRETPITGRQQAWRPGQIQDTPDDVADQLVAADVGFRSYADKVLPAVFDADGSVVGVRLPDGSIAALGPGGTVDPAVLAGKLSVPNYLGNAVANQAARLALSPAPTKASWVIQQDTGARWDFTGTDPTSNTDWTETPRVALPTLPALSVLANPDESVAGAPTALSLTELPVSDPQERRHGRLPIVSASGASLTLALEHRGQRLLRNNGASAHTTTVPTDAVGGFATDDWVIISRGSGTGAMTLQGAAGVTLVGPAGLITESGGIYSIAFPTGGALKLQKLSTANQWRVIELLSGFVPVNAAKYVAGVPAGDDAVGLALRVDAAGALRAYFNGEELGPPVYTWATKPAPAVELLGLIVRIVDQSNPFFQFNTLFEIVHRGGGVYRYVPLRRKLKWQQGPATTPTAIAAAAASAFTPLETDTFPAGLVLGGCRVRFSQLNEYTDSGSSVKNLRAELGGTALLNTASTAGGLSGYQFKDVYVSAESGAGNSVWLTGGAGAISGGTASAPVKQAIDWTGMPSVAWGFLSAVTANTGLCTMRCVEIDYSEI